MVDTLGATADTFAAVTGTFFLGLALGGWLSVRLGSTIRANLWRNVATAEALIAAFALLVLVSPNFSERLATLEFSSGLLRVLLPLLLITPPAIAMGVVTPWLIQLCLEAGRPIAIAVYGFNTAGGIAGILLSLTLFLPRLGTIGAGLAAMGLNAIVALLAFRSGVRSRERTSSQAIGSDGTKWVFGQHEALAFGSGLLVMSAEVVLQMQFAQVTINSHISGSFVLLLVLCGLTVGAILSGVWLRAFRGNFAWAMGAALLASCAAFSAQSGLFWAAFGGLRYQPYQIGMTRYFLQIAFPGLLCVTVPFVLAGLVFPLVLGRLQGPTLGVVGPAFAFNGLGGWLGAELAQGALLPRFGLWGAVCVVAAGYAALIALLSLGRMARWGLLSGALLLSVSAWCVTSGFPQVQPSSDQRIRAVGIGREGVVAVASGAPDDWRLIFNNSYTLGGSRAAANQERQALLPILLHGKAKRVATLGVATGSTASGALIHPGVARLDAIELSPLVIKYAERYFGEFNSDLFGDPRVHPVNADARWEMLRKPDTYDVVVGDLFLPWRTGEGRLFTREHFQAVRRALRPEGLFCQWLPMYQLTERQFDSIAGTFREAFPEAFIVRGDFYADKAILGLVGGRDLKDLDWGRVAQSCTLAAAGRVRDPLVRHVEGVAMLVVGPLPVSSNAPINTLDDAWLEWDAGRNIIQGGTPWFTGVHLARLLQSCHRRGAALIPQNLSAAHDSGQFFLTLEIARSARAHENQLLAQAQERLPNSLATDVQADWTKWPMKFRPQLPRVSGGHGIKASAGRSGWQ